MYKSFFLMNEVLSIVYTAMIGDFTKKPELFALISEIVEIKYHVWSLRGVSLQPFCLEVGSFYEVIGILIVGSFESSNVSVVSVFCCSSSQEPLSVVLPFFIKFCRIDPLRSGLIGSWLHFIWSGFFFIFNFIFFWFFYFYLKSFLLRIDIV